MPVTIGELFQERYRDFAALYAPVVTYAPFLITISQEVA